MQTTTHQVGRALSGPAWNHDDEPGYCTLLSSPADWNAFDDQADTATQEFVDATDFDRSVLLYAESVGPNSGYDELAFQDITVTDNILSGNTTVPDPSDDGGFYADVITYPAALLRVTGSPRPHTASLTITDGWDRTTVCDCDSRPLDAGNDSGPNPR